MNRTIIITLAAMVLAAHSLSAQQPAPPSPLPPPAPLPPPQLRVPPQSQFIPEAHTPVAIIQAGPFHPVGMPSPICECNNANKIHFPRVEKPWENCNCVNCTSFRCEMRFQWGSCQSFFGEGPYDTNYPVTPETHDKRRIVTGGPSNLPCATGNCSAR
ncbi:MAG TPA: hypothetical protein VGZ47_17495 [Gemmataceae bacterium]|jgi:hypothetical protein|nr:hypothetical protein [Gemmataceae bacterium]